MWSHIPHCWKSHALAHFDYVRILLYGPRREKSCLGVSDKASFKPVSSATGTSQNVEISPVASLHDTVQKENNKGADQTAWMRRALRLCCAPTSKDRFSRDEAQPTSTNILLLSVSHTHLSHY